MKLIYFQGKFQYTASYVGWTSRRFLESLGCSDSNENDDPDFVAEEIQDSESSSEQCQVSTKRKAKAVDKKISILKSIEGMDMTMVKKSFVSFINEAKLNNSNLKALEQILAKNRNGSSVVKQPQVQHNETFQSIPSSSQVQQEGFSDSEQLGK